jgi:hypothetical protein
LLLVSELLLQTAELKFPNQLQKNKSRYKNKIIVDCKNSNMNRDDVLSVCLGPAQRQWAHANEKIRVLKINKKQHESW